MTSHKHTHTEKIAKSATSNNNHKPLKLYYFTCMNVCLCMVVVGFPSLVLYTSIKSKRFPLYTRREGYNRDRRCKRASVCACVCVCIFVSLRVLVFMCVCILVYTCVFVYMLFEFMLRATSTAGVCIVHTYIDTRKNRMHMFITKFSNLNLLQILPCQTTHTHL